MISRLVVLIGAMLALAVACGGDHDSSPSATPIPAVTAEPSASPDGGGLGTWRTLAPLPTPRTEVAVAALDGLIYVMGGF